MSTSFVFVSTAYDCVSAAEQCFKTMYAQSYDRWRLILLDDSPTGCVADAVDALAQRLGFSRERVLTVRNNERVGEVTNTLRACETIDPNEVVVRVDMDDWLVDNDTLAIFDKIYRETGAGCVWAGHRWCDGIETISSKNISGPLPSDGCDVYAELLDNWVTSHPKSFRKDLIDAVNPTNFLDENGKTITIACDRAIYCPVLEMSKRMGRPRIFAGIVATHYNLRLSDPDLFSNERSLEQRRSAEFIHKRGFIA